MKFTGERFIPKEVNNNDEIFVEHMHRYQFVKQFIENKVVLDAACGEGYGTRLLAEDAIEVYGIDVNQETIREAKIRYVKDNLKYLEASIDGLGYFEDEHFDVIVSFETIEHVSEQLQNDFMQEAKRVLKKNGMLIISTPNKAIYSDLVGYKNEFHIKEFYIDEYRNFLEKYFQTVRLLGQRFEVMDVIDGCKNNVSKKEIETDTVADSKYIIAICHKDKNEANDAIGSVYEREGILYHIQKRIIDLQSEVEELSQWGQKLDQKNREDVELLEKRDEEIVNLSNWGKKLEGINKENTDLLEKRDCEIQALSQWGQELQDENSQNISLLEKRNEEIQVLSKWGKDLDEEIKKNIALLEKKECEILELSNWGQSLECEIGELNMTNEKLINKFEIITEKLDDMVQLQNELLSVQTSIQQYSNENKELKLKLAEQTDKIEKICNEKDEICEIKEKQIQILECEKDNLNKSVSELINERDNLNKSVSELINERDNLNKSVSDLINEKSCLTDELKCKVGHIELLLESDRELEHIKKSSGYNMLLKYYFVRDKLFPKPSKRRLVVKLVVKVIKKPSLLLEYAKPGNMLKFVKGLVTNDAHTLEVRSEKYIAERTYHSSHDIEIYQDDDNSDWATIYFQKENNPLVSIVIPVYNQWQYTYGCLKSIKDNSGDVQYEIIVADDNSSDETINIKKYVKNIEVVRNSDNKMFLLNCNNAAKYARGKYVLFLNNDTNVQKEWLSSMVECIENDSTIGLIGSKLIYQDGRLQEAGGIVWNDASGWNYGRLDDVDKADFNYVREVDYVSGASMMIPRKLWNTIGGFDERYVPAYYEDTDLAFEVRKRGYRVIYQPKSKVVHFEGISNGTDEDSGIKQYQKENRTKFLDKWNNILQEQHFPNAEHVFWANDKTKGKKTIVVVDHYVPHFDKDAGSKCTYAYVKLFLKMGLKVIFIGDNFYPHQPYTEALQQLGVFVLYGNYYYNNINKWIKDNGQYFDYAYLNRPHISVKYMDLFKKHTKAKVIYFGHDLHYIREQRNYEIEKDKKLLESSKKWKKIEFDLFDKADIIYAVGSYEHEIITNEFPNKPVRNIPVYIFEKSDDVKEYTHNGRKNIMFVGGFGHKPNIDAILWFVRDIWPLVKKELKTVKFYIIGSNPPQEIVDLASDDIVITGFVSDEELINYYKTTRLSVVPLRFGAGVKGKVVEGMYNQIPVITTGIGAEGLKGAEKGLRVSDTAEELANSIIEIYEKEKTAKKIVREGSKYVNEYFSIEHALSIVNKDIK